MSSYDMSKVSGSPGCEIPESSCKQPGLRKEDNESEQLTTMKLPVIMDAVKGRSCKECDGDTTTSTSTRHHERLSASRRLGVIGQDQVVGGDITNNINAVANVESVFHSSDADGIEDIGLVHSGQCRMFMENLVDRIFNKSASINQDDNAHFGEYCQSANGRLWFARLVDSQRVYSRKVSEQTFYRLVQFFAVCLFECYEADDFVPVKGLMNMCFTFYHEHEGIPRCDDTIRKSFLYSHLTEQPIWKSSRFWNATFFDAVHQERKQRAPQNQGNWRHQSEEEREDTETLNENITFGQLATFLHNMMELGLSQDTCQEFFLKMATIGNLSSEQKGLLETNLQHHFQGKEPDEKHTKVKRHVTKRHTKLNFMRRKSSQESLM